MPEHGAQGTLGAVGAVVAFAGVEVLRGGVEFLTGIVLLGVGVGLIALRALLRYEFGIPPDGPPSE